MVYKTPISKITGAKRTGGVAQAAECLFCKCKALSSKPSPTKKKKKKEKEIKKSRSIYLIVSVSRRTGSIGCERAEQTNYIVSL
jgi:hypothetical protein